MTPTGPTSTPNIILSARIWVAAILYPKHMVRLLTEVRADGCLRYVIRTMTALHRLDARRLLVEADTKVGQEGSLIRRLYEPPRRRTINQISAKSSPWSKKPKCLLQKITKGKKSPWPSHPNCA